MTDLLSASYTLSGCILLYTLVLFLSQEKYNEFVDSLYKPIGISFLIFVAILIIYSIIPEKAWKEKHKIYTVAKFTNIYDTDPPTGYYIYFYNGTSYVGGFTKNSIRKLNQNELYIVEVNIDKPEESSMSAKIKGMTISDYYILCNQVYTRTELQRAFSGKIESVRKKKTVADIWH